MLENEQGPGAGFTSSTNSPLLGFPSTAKSSPRPPIERVTRSGFLYRSKSLAGEGKGKTGLGNKLLRRGELSKLRIGGIIAGVVLGWLVINRILFLTSTPLVPCNAFQVPGRLIMNLTSPLHTLWLPLNPKKCPPLPPYLPALWQLTHGPDRKYPTYPSSTFPEEYFSLSSEPLPSALHPLVHPPRSSSNPKTDPIAFLRKKRLEHPPTVLVLGDSVDRNGLVHFCQLFKRNVTISHYHDISAHPPGPYPPDLTRGHGPKFDGWDQRGLMHMCEIPFFDPKNPQREATGGPIAMRVINGFHYGMDELDEFNTPDHTDWHAPGKIEKRIDQLVMKAVEQLGGPDKIDLVQLHSGMWDLALFGMQDDKHRSPLTTPLSAERLAWWQERILHTIYHVRQKFPRAKLIFRKLHRTDDVEPGTQYITNLYVSTSLILPF
ncbi:uncharacterized protein JCM6883_004960 [Sporobolomyces salmoneus]|uniref:uncharacterized protein n=1 Tax=Sporobolomyces salmoneus TaxID=183962 RepID=UPI00317821F5